MNYKEMAKVFIISFLIIGINEIILFLVTALISHQLSQSDFGDFQSFVAGMRFFGALATFGFLAFMAKYIPVLKHHLRKKEWTEVKAFYVKIIFPTVAIILMLLTLTFLCLYFIFKKDQFNHPFLLMCFVILLESFFLVAFTLLKSKSKYIASTTLYAVKHIAFLILILLFKNSSQSVYIPVICYLLAYVITLVYFVILKLVILKLEYFQKTFNFNISPVKWKLLVFPFALLAISPYLFSSLVMIVFEVFGSGSEDLVGRLGALIALFSLSLIAIFPLKTFTVNELAKVVDEPDKVISMVKSLFIFGLSACLVLFVLFNLFSGILISAMASEYHDLVSYFRVLLILLILIGMTSPFSSCLKVSNNVHFAIIFIILTTMLAITILGAIFSYFYQLEGMIFAIFLSYFIYMGLNIYFFWRVHLQKLSTLT
ncbi:MAG: hypothetical protein EP298_08755 [Gammaproteobacteria bacterium]|nr:MAG: hypothetical protein EP298_08755 [Gammaproteobacteria bacterium]UTW43126.1 hypothetical protein KFE69_02990 [bacterium SCSIO 12844]